MQRIKKFFQQFFLINDTPHKIAGGAALGIFIGIVPGEGILTTLVLASILRLNRLSATAGVLATNMWTTLLMLPLAATVGGFLFGEKKAFLISEFQRTFHLGFRFFLSKAILLDMALPLVVGFIITAGIVAGLFYAILLILLKNGRLKA